MDWPSTWRADSSGSSVILIRMSGELQTCRMHEVIVQEISKVGGYHSVRSRSKITPDAKRKISEDAREEEKRRKGGNGGH